MTANDLVEIADALADLLRVVIPGTSGSVRPPDAGRRNKKADEPATKAATDEAAAE